MGSETVPALLRAFRADHPRVRFQLVQNYGEAMIERLRAGDLDLCLTSPVPDAPDLVTAASTSSGCAWSSPTTTAWPRASGCASRRRPTRRS